MENRAQRKHIRLKQYDYAEEGVYFITFCTKNRAPLLSHIVGRGALTPPQVHVAVRFPFSHRPQHQLQPVLPPAEIRGGVPALKHPRQGRVSQMAPAQRVAPFHKTVR